MARLTRDPTRTRFLKAAPVAVVIACAAGVADAKRMALVVGNSEYDAVYSLKNAAKDAKDVAGKLKSLGFEVTLLTDTGDAAFRDQLETFASQAEGDYVESALFYFSGHAFQLDGVNYLVPKDAVLSSAEAIRTATWRLDEIVNRLESRNRSTLIFLDACRNNPLPESARGNSSEGLAKLETGSGTFVAFATQPNNVTADGAGDNSPFTEALLTHLATEGISISDLMIRVRNAVEDATFSRQTPWDQSSLRAQFYFKPRNEKAMLSQADYEMLAGLDEETRNRLLDLMGAERIDVDTDRVDDMEVAIQVVAYTEDIEDPVSAEEDGGGMVITGVTDDALEKIIEGKMQADESGDEGGFVITSVLSTSAPEIAGPATGAAVAADEGTVVATAEGTAADTATEAATVVAAAPSTDAASESPDVQSAQTSSDAVMVSTLSVGAAQLRAPSSEEEAVLAGISPDAPAAADRPALTAELVPGAASSNVRVAQSELVLAALSPTRAVDVVATRATILGQEPDEGDLQIVGVAEPSWPQLEGRALAREVQTELSRLGCYRMKVDGAFGRGSKLSLVRYYGNRGIAADTLEPTNALLQVLRAEPQVVCENTTEIADRRVATVSTRVATARKKVQTSAVVERKQRLSTGTTRTNSKGETVNTSRIRPGAFR